MSSSIGRRLNEVLKRIADAHNSSVFSDHGLPRLVAVSKEKPIEDIVHAYKFGQRHFGENRIQSLVEKSQQLKDLCPDIRWHYIGRLQSNKIKLLGHVHNLFLVETVDTVDHAMALNKMRCASLSDPLKIMLQINTSGEEQKSGLSPDQLPVIYRSIVSSCNQLQVVGLMCIGRFIKDCTSLPNPDFTELVRCRNLLCSDLGIPANSLELSMGMSNDFEEAKMSEAVTPVEKKQPLIFDENGKQIKMCCACPETRAARDACLLESNEDECLNYIDAHKACLRKLGFRI